VGLLRYHCSQLLAAEVVDGSCVQTRAGSQQWRAGVFLGPHRVCRNGLCIKPNTLDAYFRDIA